MSHDLMTALKSSCRNSDYVFKNIFLQKSAGARKIKIQRKIIYLKNIGFERFKKRTNSIFKYCVKRKRTAYLRDYLINCYFKPSINWFCNRFVRINYELAASPFRGYFKSCNNASLFDPIRIIWITTRAVSTCVILL